VTTNIDDTNVGLTVGDVLRTQLYYPWAAQTIGDAASEFVRRDIENLVINMPDGSVRLLSQRALNQALLPSSQELFETSRSPSEVDFEDIAVDHAANPAHLSTIGDSRGGPVERTSDEGLGHDPGEQRTPLPR
jgi:hypothetical protein